MGNEAIVTPPTSSSYLIEGRGDPGRSPCSSSRSGTRTGFFGLADRALAAGKPIVALKVGRSPAGRGRALAHTGAVAGDDAVVGAVLRQHGVVRVDSLEELLTTGRRCSAT